MTINQTRALVVTMHWNPSAYREAIDAMDLPEFLEFLTIEDVVKTFRDFARFATV